jgi:hypothetical protein
MFSLLAVKRESRRGMVKYVDSSRGQALGNQESTPYEPRLALKEDVTRFQYVCFNTLQ